MRESNPGKQNTIESLQEKLGKQVEIDLPILLQHNVMKLQMRYATDRTESKKDLVKSVETVSDHLFTCSYILDYIYPLLEKLRITVDFQKTFDILLASDLPDLNYKHEVYPQKPIEVRNLEILDMFLIVGDSPKAEGFNKQIWEAYKQSVLLETLEAKLAKAIKGVATMMYIYSKQDKYAWQKMIAENGFTEELYEKRIGKYAKQFPGLANIYERLLKGFKKFEVFADVTQNLKGSEEAVQTKLLEKLQGLEGLNSKNLKDVKNPSLNTEINSVMSILRLKRKNRYGNDEKRPEEHKDSVAEHTYTMLYLARYFLPIINKRRQSLGKKPISFYNVHSCILAHDASEGLLGDVPVITKTQQDTLSEDDANRIVVEKHLPKLLGFDKRGEKMIDDYTRSKRTLEPEYAVFVKAIDCIEAYLYLYDFETRQKIENMELLDRHSYAIKIQPIIDYFPELKKWWNRIMLEMEKEGMK